MQAGLVWEVWEEVSYRYFYIVKLLTNQDAIEIERRLNCLNSKKSKKGEKSNSSAYIVVVVESVEDVVGEAGEQVDDEPGPHVVQPDYLKINE